jgi:transposase
VQTLRAAVDALQRRRHTPATATTEQYCTRFRGSLWEILNLYPKLVAGQRLLKRYQKIRAHLLLFLSDETIPLTNHTSEQALCWSADGLATGLSNYDIDEE